MPKTIAVRFAYASRDLLFDVEQTGAQSGDHVICATERGTEIGLAVQDPQEMTEEAAMELTSGVELKPVLRVATKDDLAYAEELAEKGEAAMPSFRSAVKALELDMKPVGVEYLFEGDKAVCYFAAEERVDFRQLVRELSRELHARIDMRQIGVREEAAVMGGYGHCGQELCCTRFGLAFEPVSIRMAKEQDLPLNSTKISGACGRLMCCLRYEFEAYRDFKSRAPKKNTVIDTPLGMAKIVEYNTPKEELALRVENGKVIRIALADMTASEAACQKSKEQGCACRPDTVTREVLDRLQSPDVQMALAELDRKNGLLPEEEIDTSDIFVTTPRSRRRTTEEQDFVPSAEQSSTSQDTPEPQAKSRRRRRRTNSEGDAQNKQVTQQPELSTQKTISSRRRRHHTTSTQESSNTSDATRQDSTFKPRRRPGDKGGKHLGQTTGTTPSDNNNASNNNSASTYRRRRHRKGNANGSDSN